MIYIYIFFIIYVGWELRRCEKSKFWKIRTLKVEDDPSELHPWSLGQERLGSTPPCQNDQMVDVIRFVNSW